MVQSLKKTIFMCVFPYAEDVLYYAASLWLGVSKVRYKSWDKLTLKNRQIRNHSNEKSKIYTNWMTVKKIKDRKIASLNILLWICFAKVSSHILASKKVMPFVYSRFLSEIGEPPGPQPPPPPLMSTFLRLLLKNFKCLKKEWVE